MKDEGKGFKLVGCSSGASTKNKSDEIGRVSVDGFDTTLPTEVIVRALKSHFSSCGKITDIFIPNDYPGRKHIKCPVSIYFVGEGAVGKALQLDGSNVRGCDISVVDSPFPRHGNNSAHVIVEGFETLSKTYVESELRKLFSSIGVIKKLLFLTSDIAEVVIRGQDVAFNVPSLDGSVVGGRKLSVIRISSIISPVEKRSKFYGNVPEVQHLLEDG